MSNNNTRYTYIICLLDDAQKTLVLLTACPKFQLASTCLVSIPLATQQSQHVFNTAYMPALLCFFSVKSFQTQLFCSLLSLTPKCSFSQKRLIFLYKIKNTMCGCQWIRKSEHSPRWRAYWTNFTLKSIFRTRTRRSCLYFGLWPGLSSVVVKLTSS